MSIRSIFTDGKENGPKSRAAIEMLQVESVPGDGRFGTPAKPHEQALARLRVPQQSRTIAEA
jgi:hypothetical protein